MTLHEILGRETEARHQAQALAEVYLGECRKLLHLLGQLKSGEVSLDRVQVGPDSWRVLAEQPADAPPAAAYPTADFPE